LFILRDMQALRNSHPWVAAVMRDLSGLGGTAILTLCTTITVGYLALTSARRMAGLAAIAVITGAARSKLLKAAFARVRPGVSASAHSAARAPPDRVCRHVRYGGPDNKAYFSATLLAQQRMVCRPRSSDRRLGSAALRTPWVCTFLLNRTPASWRTEA
jgi:hypothetical protein